LRDETHQPEGAEFEAAAASSSDLSSETASAEPSRAADGMRASAVRHPSAALEIVPRAKGGGA
jgi:hypothetical protein